MQVLKNQIIKMIREMDNLEHLRYIHTLIKTLLD